MNKQIKLFPLLLASMLCAATMQIFAVVIGPISRALSMPEWQSGLMVTMAGFVWLMTSRAWGIKSDRLGRKKILLWGSLGLTLSYLGLAIFTEYSLQNHNEIWVMLLIFIVLRGMMGGFFAAIPVANSALIADHYQPATRGPKMALLGASNGFGLVLGPLMASFIVGDGLTHPLFLGGFLAMLALLIVYFGLPQTQVISAAPKATVRLFDPRLRLPMLSAFISMSCVITCQIVVGFFCLDVLHLDNQSAAKVSAQAMASVGIALIFTQIVITKLVYIQPKTWLSTGTLIAAIAMVLMFWVSTPIHLMAVYALIAVGLGMVFPSIQTLAANAVTNSEQGVAAGSLGAAQAMGTCLAPLAATLIYTLSPSLPYLLFGLSLAVLSVFSFYSATDTSAKEMLEN